MGCMVVDEFVYNNLYIYRALQEGERHISPGFSVKFVKLCIR